MKALTSLLAVLLAVLAVVSAGSPADAATRKKQKVTKERVTKERPGYDLPMRVVIVRNAVAGCEPLCPQWISAEGQITPKSPAVFKKALDKAKGLKLPVIVTSPGGDVDAALRIGEMIRAYHADVAVGWTYFGGCAPHQKGCKPDKKLKGAYPGIIMGGQGFCVSACSFILAAGEKRVLGDGTFVGVHQISRTITRERVRYVERYRIVNGRKKVLSRKVVGRNPMKSYVSTKLDRRLEKKLIAYFTRMGVGKELLDLFNKAPPSSMHVLTLLEMTRTRLVTDLTFALDMGAGDRCKTAPPAGNCVLLQEAAAKP